MDSITNIKFSKEKPDTEQCIIMGKMNYINYMYLNEDSLYVIVFSKNKLSDNDIKYILDNNMCKECYDNRLNLNYECHNCLNKK